MSYCCSRIGAWLLQKPWPNDPSLEIASQADEIQGVGVQEPILQRREISTAFPPLAVSGDAEVEVAGPNFEIGRVCRRNRNGSKSTTY